MGPEPRPLHHLGGRAGGGQPLAVRRAFPYRFRPFAVAVLGIAVACLLLPVGRRWMRDPRRFAWFQLALDVVLVTGVVATTGGPESIFVPLYVLAAVAACFVLSRPGALVVAGLSSLLQVALVVGRSTVVLLGLAEPSDTAPLEVLAAVLNAAMLLIVSMVTASLVDRYRRSEHHLGAQQRSLSDVKAFRDVIFESVGSGLVAVDAGGRVTAFNRAADSITASPPPMRSAGRGRPSSGRGWTSMTCGGRRRGTAPGRAPLRVPARAPRRREGARGHHLLVAPVWPR